MKKKTKIIILVAIVLMMILIPVGIVASKGLEMHFASDEEIAQANKEETERALAEKQKFAETHPVQEYDEKVIKEFNDATLDGKLEESEDKDEKRAEIIRRYYPNELEQALKDVENDTDIGMVEINSSPLKNYERNIYDMFLKVLEKEKLTNEESELLKEYVEDNMYNIKKDEDLKVRAEKILNK